MKLLSKKLLSGLLSLSMLASLSIPAFAYNSIGSNSEDLSVGEDTAQGTATEYHDPISSGVSSAQTDVYVTRSSTFTVLVPKTIILNGSDGIGSYVVGAKGDVLAEDAISIEPDSYELTLYKKGAPESTVEALISQEETQLTGDTIEAALPSYALLDGLIEAPNLRAGSWSAKMQFNINLVENGEVIEPEESIIYQDFIITSENRYKISYTDDTTDLVISETFYNEEDGVWYKVIAIGDYAFSNCENLKSVIIPDSVTSIGEYAFYECTSLTSATIPDSVTTISGYIFTGCKNLESVVIPDSVTSIGFSAFNGCISLTSITIPDSVTSIGEDAFITCTNLESVIIGSSVTEIGAWAFNNCTNLTSVVISNSVTTIGMYAFSYCTSLTELRVPSSVIDIGSSAFQNVPKVIYNGPATSFNNWGAKSIATA